MNYKQMVLLEALLRRMWHSPLFRLAFIFKDEVCSGNFIEENTSQNFNGPNYRNSIVDVEKLENDYNHFLKENKGNFTPFKEYKDEDEETRTVIFRKTLFERLNSF